MPKTKPLTTSAEEAQKLATTWSTRHHEAETNQKPIFDRAKENYDIYFAQMPEEEKAKNWRSNTFLPILSGKARDAKAKMGILEPRFIVRPADNWKFDEESKEMTFDQDAVNASMKLTKKLNRDFISYTATGELPPRANIDFCMTDAFVAGWGLGLAPLKSHKKIYRLHKLLKDADNEDSAYADMKQSIEKSILRCYTELEAIDIFRAWISPRARSWEHPYWVILGREESYADLKRKNGTKGEEVYDLPAWLEDAKGTVADNKNEYSGVRDTPLGFSQDKKNQADTTINLFNVFDCYDQETGEFLTFIDAKNPDTAAGKWTLIRRMKNPYFHGLIPIIPFHIARRQGSPWGESFFEISKQVQHAYNSAYNGFADNAQLSRETMAVIDKNSNVDGFEIGPGNTIEYDSLNGEKPEPWKMSDPNPAVLAAQMEFLEKNIENGTTPQYNSGQVNSSMDKTAGTKGGIEMLMEAANDKMSAMYRNLKGSLLRYGYISMMNAQQYQNYIEVLDQPKNPELAGKVDVLTPAELQMPFDLDIDEESLLPMTKSERRQLWLDFVQMMIDFQKASSTQVEAFNTPEDFLRIDWPDLAKELGAQFGELNAPVFIKQPYSQRELAQKKVTDAQIEQQANDKAMEVARGNDPEADVEQTPNGIQVQRQKRELSNFKDYPADVKNAVLESFGYPASQIVAEQAKAQVAKAQGEQMDAQVKKQVIDSAMKGQVDPATLAKFIAK